MAKKKKVSTKKDTSTKDLEKRLDVAKQLLADKDKELAESIERIDGLEQEIGSLHSQIESDKGLPPDNDEELESLRRQIGEYKNVNQSLSNELEQLKLSQAATPASKSSTNLALGAKTSLSPDQVLQCLPSYSSVNTDRLAKQIPGLIDQAILLAEAVHERCSE